jgi:O-antigen/teichoic acid export membrane protein
MFINFFKNKLLFNGIIISFFLGISGLIAYWNQILVINYLTINDYVTYAYFFSIFSLISSSIGGLSFVYIKILSLLNKNFFLIRLHYFKNSKIFLVVISIIFMFTYLFNSQISFLLNLEILYIYLILLYFTLNFFLILNNALFCSQKLFNLFIINNIGNTLIRTILLLSFIFFKLKLIYILLSAILSAFIMLCINTFSLIKFFKFNKILKIQNDIKTYNKPYDKKFILNTIISNVVITFFLQSDIILIKNIFEDQDTVGYFYIAAILGKGVLYITLGFVSAFFPISSAFKEKSKNNAKYFYKYLLYSILISLLLIIFFFLFSDFFLKLFFKDKIKIDESIFILKFYGLIILPFAIINLIESYLISRGKFLFTWICLIFAPIYLFLTYFFSFDLYYFLVIYFLSGIIIMIIGYFFITYSKFYASKAGIFNNYSSKRIK